MRAVVQRVSRAKVAIADEITGQIGHGLLILLGVSTSDLEADADHLVDKIVNLRIFDDSEGKMNHSVADAGGSLLVVSQFTLYADTRRGRRPSYLEAAPPETANRLYEYFVNRSRQFIEHVATGRFQAMMGVELVNDGPVTIILDSDRSN